MTESERTQPETPEAPVERPSWRFSGRRGTPVHMRERTPATLPPEIKQMVAQMAREHAGEQQAQAEGAAPKPKQASKRAATSTLRLPHDEARQSPPVAGAPLPVERRTRSEAGDAVVSTTPIDAVPAPQQLPVPDEVVALAMTADAEPAAADQRETKARAKARAKAEREAAEQAEGKRRLFARGREVDPAAEEIAVEPVAEVEPTAAEPIAAVEAITAVEAMADAMAERTAESQATPSPEPYLLEAIDHAPSATTEPVVTPDPAIALEAANQAAWELGRLPFLLPQSAFDEPASAEPVAASLDDEPIVELDIPRARTEQPELLRTLDWAPVDPAAGPAPLTAEIPKHAPPAEIAALGEPLHVPRREPADRLSARAGTRVELGHGRGTLDSADARRRVVERRAQLDQVVAELATLAARHAD
jgi:hypothetical protein